LARQGSEGLLYKAQKREAERLAGLAGDVAQLAEALKAAQDDNRRLQVSEWAPTPVPRGSALNGLSIRQDTLATEMELRRQTGKQFLAIVDQQRIRASDIAERTALYETLCLTLGCSLF
jgi:hypothetical protein